MQELNPYRGYESSVESVIAFWIGKKYNGRQHKNYLAGWDTCKQNINVKANQGDQYCICHRYNQPI